MQSVGPLVKVAYFVPPSQHFAGVERVVHEIAAGLAESCPGTLDVHVVFATRYTEKALEHTAYTQHVLDVQRLRQLSSGIRSCVARERFDVLVCPQVEASVLTWFATRGLRLPVFLTHLHGNPRIEESRGTWRTRAAFLLFRRLVSRRIDGVLAVSPSLQRYTAEHLTTGVPVVYVPNPVRDFEAAGRPAVEGAPFQFVTVARLSYQKGQDVLLRAVALARPRLPAFHVTLVGSGPDEAALTSLCTDLGLDDVVTFAGYRTDPDRYLAAADCFVLPSRWEGFGVALVEALRFGVAVLSTDCDFGPADVITDPSLGELVAVDDPQALADGMVRASTRASRAEDRARRRAVADSYSRSVVVADHAAVLRSFTDALPRA